MEVDEKRSLIDLMLSNPSVRRQCELLGLNRSNVYYTAALEDECDLLLKRLIDEEYTRHPFIGTRRMVCFLRDVGHWVNRKRVQRLYREMGIEAVYPKPRLSENSLEHRVFPYLLRDLEITRPNQVWSADITYIRLAKGFVYLVAIIDWFSRYVLDFELSVTLEADFCVESLERALSNGRCEIFNTDQGVQFTSHLFLDTLLSHNIRVSMDGRGRAFDNIFIERLWRSVKYEMVYLKDFRLVPELRTELTKYFDYYNHRRPHQSLEYRKPAEVYGLI